MPPAETDLGDLLAQVLPADVRVTIRHVSSIPRPCAALFVAPPGMSPETTFCENHYLSVSTNDGNQNNSEIILFGMEVLIYTSAQLTTIFVSKADSTGFLHKLEIPAKVSLLRLISNAFLSFLAQTRQRDGVRLVVSLFARAQNQYLFPGSIHNPGKHVLDDRGLIKWWCRALDPIIRRYEPESVFEKEGTLNQTMESESAKSSATAFLIVPGCDRFEFRGFFPASARSDDQSRPRWLNMYPRQQLCRNPDAPPRCLIPRFPDDPKTRFLVDLDNELPAPGEDGAGDSAAHSGQWRSVKSLEQFWDMMAFRQECSAGRLVGFLWVIINPPGLVNSIRMADSARLASKSSVEAGSGISESNVPEPASLEPSNNGQSVSDPQPLESAPDRPNPQVTEPNPFYWPEAGRGHVVLNGADYKSAIDSLLENEFYNEQISVDSTKAWVDKVASLADQLIWGRNVVGKNAVGETTAQSTEPNNLLGSGLVRKRKKDEDKSGSNEAPASTTQPAEQSPGVNVLNANVIRKKKKT